MSGPVERGKDREQRRRELTEKAVEAMVQFGSTTGNLAALTNALGEVISRSPHSALLGRVHLPNVLPGMDPLSLREKAVFQFTSHILSKLNAVERRDRHLEEYRTRHQFLFLQVSEQAVLLGALAAFTADAVERGIIEELATPEEMLQRMLASKIVNITNLDNIETLSEEARVDPYREQVDRAISSEANVGSVPVLGGLIVKHFAERAVKFLPDLTEQQEAAMVLYLSKTAAYIGCFAALGEMLPDIGGDTFSMGRAVDSAVDRAERQFGRREATTPAPASLDAPSVAWNFSDHAVNRNKMGRDFAANVFRIKLADFTLGEPALETIRANITHVHEALELGSALSQQGIDVQATQLGVYLAGFLVALHNTVDEGMMPGDTTAKKVFDRIPGVLNAIVPSEIHLDRSLGMDHIMPDLLQIMPYVALDFMKVFEKLAATILPPQQNRYNFALTAAQVFAAVIEALAKRERTKGN